MDLYHENFEINFPAFFFVTLDSVEATGTGEVRLKPPVNFVALNAITGEQSFPVFTDRDLAERFIKTATRTSAVMLLGAHGPERLLEILNIVRHTAGFVVFDPARASGLTPRTFRIEHVIERLRRANP